MAEFKEIMKQRERMCDAFTDKYGERKCNKCILNNRSIYGCCHFVVDDYEEAEELIMKWVEEHPIKTNADKFKEVFGVEPNLTGCVGIKCPEECVNSDDCSGCNFKDFWNQEYKEFDKE